MRQNQSARYAFLFMYVSCPPLPSVGFQQGYDATKLGKIIQTAKFFFGKVLEGVQNCLRVLLSPPHIKLPKVSGFKDESVKISKKHVKIVSVAARNRGCMILSWHWKTAVKSAASSCRRFYGGFLSFSWLLCMSLIFNVIRKFVFYRCACVSSKTVQNACKTVCFGSSSSQSCGLTLTILQSYIDYLRLLNTQNSMPEGTERHLEAYFSSPETRFSCLGECAGKCQRQCQYDIIIAMPEDRLVQQKNV